MLLTDWLRVKGGGQEQEQGQAQCQDVCWSDNLPRLSLDNHQPKVDLINTHSADIFNQMKSPLVCVLLWHLSWLLPIEHQQAANTNNNLNLTEQGLFTYYTTTFSAFTYYPPQNPTEWWKLSSSPSPLPFTPAAVKSSSSLLYFLPLHFSGTVLPSSSSSCRVYQRQWVRVLYCCHRQSVFVFKELYSCPFWQPSISLSSSSSSSCSSSSTPAFSFETLNFLHRITHLML